MVAATIDETVRGTTKAATLGAVPRATLVVVELAVPQCRRQDALLLQAAPAAVPATALADATAPAGGALAVEVPVGVRATGEAAMAVPRMAAAAAVAPAEVAVMEAAGVVVAVVAGVAAVEVGVVAVAGAKAVAAYAAAMVAKVIGLVPARRIEM